MKKIFILLAFTFCVQLAFSQPQAGTFSIIPRLGINLSKVNNDQIHGVGNGSESTVSHSIFHPVYLGGVELNYQSSTKAAFSFGINYSQQGAGYKDIAWEYADGTKGEGISNHNLYMDYINFPILLHAYCAPNVAFHMGVQPGFLVRAKRNYFIANYTIDKKTGEKKYDNMKEITDDVKGVCNNFAFSIPLGLSYEYLNVILSATYNLSLTKAFKSEYEKSRHSVLSFSLAYRLPLGN